MTAQVLDICPIEHALSWADAFPIDERDEQCCEIAESGFSLSLTHPPSPSRKSAASRASSRASTQPPSCKPTRVRFAPCVSNVVGTVVPRSGMSEDDRRDRYLRPAEYRACKLLARFDAATIVRCAPSSVDAIEIVYESLASLTDILDDGELDAFLKDPTDLALNFGAWARTPGGRGLERWVSEVQDVHRFGVAMEARRVVLCGAELGGFDDEEVALLYQERSRFSVAYARVVGEADATAATEAWCSSDAPATRTSTGVPSKVAPSPTFARRPAHFSSASSVPDSARL